MENSGNCNKKMSVSSNTRGIMMILSPAKTMDLSPHELPPGLQGMPSSPDCEISKTSAIVNVMKKRTSSELEKLLSISKNIAKTAHAYWKDFDASEESTTVENGKPCIFAYSGAAYQGLCAHELSESSIQYLQANLRIIDAVYGLLRPLDRIQAYRLEMQTRNVFPEKNVKLVDYWKESVSKRLAQELENRDNKILLNLASDEYSVVVDASMFPSGAKFIKVVFREEHGRVISVHAKKARGMMARFIADNNVVDLEGVKKFAEERYEFNEKGSTETTLMFDRARKRNANTEANKKSPKKRTKK